MNLIPKVEKVSPILPLKPYSKNQSQQSNFNFQNQNEKEPDYDTFESCFKHQKSLSRILKK